MENNQVVFNINDINPNKTLMDILQTVMSNIIEIVNCVKIGEIISFDKTDQTCSVRVLYKPNKTITRFSKKLIEYPVLKKVPCVVMGGGGSYITHPISAGDQCLLLFSDFMIDNWWATGQASKIDFERHHDIADAIAIVGLNALPNAIQNYSDYLDLHYSDNSSIIVGNTVEVNNQTINLNGNTNVTGNETVSGVITAQTLNATSAANGTFVTEDNKRVTVVNGIITSIA